jgi:hypothetical protein
MTPMQPPGAKELNQQQTIEHRYHRSHGCTRIFFYGADRAVFNKKKAEGLRVTLL